MRRTGGGSGSYRRRAKASGAAEERRGLPGPTALMGRPGTVRRPVRRCFVHGDVDVAWIEYGGLRGHSRAFLFYGLE
ncbi:hypothetical protein BRADI_4g00772v3 [Brachypodium distachyon]|uniref:Uncharacterized protein n=1 Tax=Brachypodium distachyon TaxID=15368 RepID=A0A2K2CJS5_BRADI|nr:hypothetical protein BRADI_4g00772v3 [Brachypodium distachyon]